MHTHGTMTNLLLCTCMVHVLCDAMDSYPMHGFPHGLYYTHGSLMISYTSGYYVHLTSSYICISWAHTKLTSVHICEINMCSNA